MTNREIDAAIAEKVMGIPREWIHDNPNGKHISGIGRIAINAPYSTSIAAAWTVVEKLMEAGWTVTLAPRQFEKHPEDRFKFHGCRMVKDGGTQRMQSFSDHAETMPLAICKAALEAAQK